MRSRRSLFSRLSGFMRVDCPACESRKTTVHFVFDGGPSLSDVLECRSCGAFTTRADLLGVWSEACGREYGWSGRVGDTARDVTWEFHVEGVA